MRTTVQSVRRGWAIWCGDEKQFETELTEKHARAVGTLRFIQRDGQNFLLPCRACRADHARNRNHAPKGEAVRSAQQRLWILYDGRACGALGTEDAAVLSTAESDQEAREDARMFGFQLACYSYAIQGKALVDERWEWDFHNTRTEPGV